MHGRTNTVAASIHAVVCIVTASAGCAVSDSTYREEGQAYVERTIPAILSTWDPAPLLAAADPAFRKQTSDSQTRELVAAFSREFGSVRRISLVAGSTGIGAGSWTGKFAQFTYSLDCDKGGATLVVSVHRTRHGDWTILGFHLDPNTESVHGTAGG
jgi:hypothetical protein